MSNFSLKLVPKGHPALTTSAESVDVSNKKLVKDLTDTLNGALNLQRSALGIALPQVGLSYRGFAISARAFPFRLKNLICFNPRVTDGIGFEISEEGCLSLPNEVYKVRRYKNIGTAFYDEMGRFNNQRFKDLIARVYQHELDHLNGILISSKQIKDENNQ